MRKLLLLPLLSLLALPRFAQAAIADTTGLKATGDVAIGTELTTTVNSNITVFIGYYIIQPVLGVVGLIFFLLMIYAGILWMSAGGNSEQVKKAKQIFVNGIIGVVVITASYAITAAVFNAVSTGSVTG